MVANIQFQTVLLSSLSKVFADEAPLESAYTRASALQGENFAFQIAFTSNTRLKNIQVEVASSLGIPFTIRAVGLVPSEMPSYADADSHVLTTAAGLYPDPLYPVEELSVTALPGQWRSLWINVELDTTVLSGAHKVSVRLCSAEGELLGEEELELIVIGAELPKQKLIHTEWFHTDCLANYYKVAIFNEEHWRRIGEFIETAVKHGINMILTPIFTPPLDTAVGGERPTVQLIDVTIVDGTIADAATYQFNYDKLERWVALCREKGVEYFEFSHLFTQWGAKHTPKIIATLDGVEQRIFGWETDASGEAYAHFLRQLLPDLDRVIQKLGIASCSYFHISDEPMAEHKESYKKASDIVKELLPNYPIIDALTDIAFYEQGLVQKPIPSNDHIGPFLEAGVPDLWTYYCCVQYKDVSNRFFNMPSARNRIIGLQLYKFGIQGFLHWGYNFYNSQYSEKQINPFLVTDALHTFPSGDSFVVYPGEAGPIESIRLEVFYEALQDLRALALLETHIGKERTIALIEEGLVEPLTFSVYPRNTEWMLAVRERINQAIASVS
jgi:hypothetical protein